MGRAGLVRISARQHGKFPHCYMRRISTYPTRIWGARLRGDGVEEGGISQALLIRTVDPDIAILVKIRLAELGGARHPSKRSQAFLLRRSSCIFRGGPSGYGGFFLGMLKYDNRWLILGIAISPVTPRTNLGPPSQLPSDICIEGPQWYIWRAPLGADSGCKVW